jgi:hypothetical protein
MTSLLTDPAEIAAAQALCEAVVEASKYDELTSWYPVKVHAMAEAHPFLPRALATIEDQLRCAAIDAKRLSDLSIEKLGWAERAEKAEGECTELRATIEAQAAEMQRRRGDPVTRLHNLAQSIEGVTDAYTKGEFHMLDAENAKMREAIRKIAGGFINSDCLMSDPPDWHSAFSQLQAIAQRANALSPSAASLRYQRMVDVVEAAKEWRDAEDYEVARAEDTLLDALAAELEKPE